MEVFGIKEPTARKEHKCELCHGTINKGEKYVRWACADGGQAESIKVHSLCYSVLESCLEIGEEFSWDEMEDYIRRVCIENNLCQKDTLLSVMVVLVDEWNNRDGV